MKLELGKFYLLRGGDVVVNEGGGSWGPEQVVRELTKADARFLRRRAMQLYVRGLKEELAWTNEVMDRLGVNRPVRFGVK